MRGILIDTKNRTITQVEVVRNEEGSILPSIYDHVKCSMVEVVPYNDFNDVYVDEEGLFKVNEDTTFFKLKEYPQPISGNGLILGFDSKTGDSVDTDLSVSEVVGMVTFMSAYEVMKSYRLQ
jgi:hypothetical protein